MDVGGIFRSFDQIGRCDNLLNRSLPHSDKRFINGLCCLVAANEDLDGGSCIFIGIQYLSSPVTRRLKKQDFLPCFRLWTIAFL